MPLLNSNSFMNSNKRYLELIKFCNVICDVDRFNPATNITRNHKHLKRLFFSRFDRQTYKAYMSYLDIKQDCKIQKMRHGAIKCQSATSLVMLRMQH